MKFQRVYTRLLIGKLFDADTDLLILRMAAWQRKSAPVLSAGSWLGFATMGLLGVANPWLYLIPLVGSVGALLVDEESDRAVGLLLPLLQQRDEARRFGEKEILEAQLVNLKEMLDVQHGWFAAQLTGSAPAALPSITEATPQPQKAVAGHWFDELVEYPSILIYGGQGAGKTSFSACLIRTRVERGHRVVVLDPHRKCGAWNGLEVIGDGMNYEAIDSTLGWLEEEIRDRYHRYSTDPDPQFETLTIVCDEFTNWAARCSNSAAFFDAALSDIRKIGICVVLISHARTLKGLGGSSGMAQTRDVSLLEIELLAQVDPVSKKASPKLEGWLKFPGQSKQERLPIKLEPWMNCSMDFTDVIPNGDGEAITTISPHPHSSLTTTAHQLEASIFGDFPEYSPIPEGWELRDPLSPTTPEIRAVVVACHRTGWSQNRALVAIWKCSKGGKNNRPYEAARRAYQEVLKLANLI